MTRGNKLICPLRWLTTYSMRTSKGKFLFSATVNFPDPGNATENVHFPSVLGFFNFIPVNATDGSYVRSHCESIFKMSILPLFYFSIILPFPQHLFFFTPWMRRSNSQSEQELPAAAPPKSRWKGAKCSKLLAAAEQGKMKRRKGKVEEERKGMWV